MFKYNCTSPNPVRDKTGRIIYYPCGKCKNCINKRASVYSKMIDYEINTHKYNFFITLTYDNDNIPKLLVTYKYGYATLTPEWNYVNPITGEYQETFVKINSNDYGKLNKVICKTSESIFTTRYIPCLRYSDVQKFLKRLRINVYRYAKTIDKHVQIYDCSFKFFCLCEYGPDTFRPHYHLILHTDTAWLGSYLRRSVSPSKRANGKLDIACWQCGFIDLQCVSGCGQINSYLSSYVSMANDVSSIYSHQFIKQKNFHSKHYGDFFANNRNCDLYLLSAMSPEDFHAVSNITPLGVFKPSESYYVVNSLYPKVPYAEKFNSFDLHAILNLSRKNVFHKISRFAAELTDELYYSNESKFIDKLVFNNLKDVLNFAFRENLHRFAYKYYSVEHYRKEFFESLIRRYLYASLKWCRYHNDNFMEIDKYLSFYDYRTKLALSNFYINQEVYYAQYRYDSNDLVFWYRNLPPDGSIKQFKPSLSPIQMQLNTYHEDLSRIRKNQKLHNDKNRILG